MKKIPLGNLRRIESMRNQKMTPMSKIFHMYDQLNATCIRVLPLQTFDRCRFGKHQPSPLAHREICPTEVHTPRPYINSQGIPQKPETKHAANRKRRPMSARKTRISHPNTSRLLIIPEGVENG